MSDFEAARLTVRLGAVASNYRLCQRLAGPAAVAGVVKADGYGIGLRPSHARARRRRLRHVLRRAAGGGRRRCARSCPNARIFVLDGARARYRAALIGHRLTPVLNSLAEIAGWAAAARETHTALDAAIHIDTGMNRLGLPGEELVGAGAGVRRSGSTASASCC